MRGEKQVSKGYKRIRWPGGIRGLKDGTVSATNGIDLRQRVETEAQLTMVTESIWDKERDMQAGGEEGRNAHTQIVDVLAVIGSGWNVYVTIKGFD